MRSTEPTKPDPLADASDRQRLWRARDLTMGSLFGALAIVLPIAFHALGLGRFFLPMYLPVLALGLLAGWRIAALVGFIAPLLSGALTGMPPFAPPTAVLMALELATLAISASLCRSAGLGIWPASVIAILAARAVGTLTVLAVGQAFGLPQGVREYAIAAFVASWPGIALLLTVVPGAVYAIEQTSIIGPRAGRHSA